jgi:hypothetical protein
MDDREILARISKLVDEEHRLERSHHSGPLPGDEREHLWTSR